jgi:hypothetical protein
LYLEGSKAQRLERIASSRQVSAETVSISSSFRSEMFVPGPRRQE